MYCSRTLRFSSVFIPGCAPMLFINLANWILCHWPLLKCVIVWKRLTKNHTKYNLTASYFWNCIFSNFLQKKPRSKILWKICFYGIQNFMKQKKRKAKIKIWIPQATSILFLRDKAITKFCLFALWRFFRPFWHAQFRTV